MRLKIIDFILGVIRKQGIQGSILLYAGVFVGFITTALVFPKLLKTEQIGLINTLFSYSTVFAQFATLGFTSVIIRNFSYFRNYKNKHNHFFFLVFWVMVIGSVLSILSYYLLKPVIIAQNIKNAPLFVEYIDYLIPLIIFTLVFFILDTYYTVLFKTVRGIILRDLVQKVVILLAVYLYFISIYHFRGFIIAYIIALCFPGIVLLIYIIAEGEWVITPKLDFINKDLTKSMLNVSLFGILTSLVGSANMQIDRALSSSMISLGATGVYTTVAIFASLLTVPSRAFLKISSAIIADAWKRNDILQIKKIYDATCINQYVIALLVFVGLLGNTDNIFQILGKDYIGGKYVIFWLGLSYAIEMASGASSNIIATSRNYKVLTWMVGITLIIIVGTNMVFIPKYQITGIAIAAAITRITFTLIKVLYVYFKYDLQPFNIKFVYLTGIALTVYLISYWIHPIGNLYIDIILRSGGISLIFVLLIVIFRISPEINEKVVELKTKYLK